MLRDHFVFMACSRNGRAFILHYRCIVVSLDEALCGCLSSLIAGLVVKTLCASKAGNFDGGINIKMF